uniref:FHA domain-containing protein n=1 Tax=Eubacterium cellulosolvens TaxID=29322 RepID=UPI000486B7AC|nr:FHA domain-containing protein [[Eubacterium] cellulosolvens]
MREFLLNSEDFLDRKAVAFLRDSGMEKGLLPISWVHFNERVKLACFPDNMKTIGSVADDLTLDEACRLGKAILERLIVLEEVDEISLENVIWDPDSIYLNAGKELFFICMPAQIPYEQRHSEIYLKRVYALLGDLVSEKEGGDFVSRQIDFQKERAFGDWTSLLSALDQRSTRDEDDACLILKSINTPAPVTFEIGHRKFRIGTDPGEVDGLITGVETVSPVHALIGWNEINYYVSDLGSENGTFVNDQQIAPNTEVPIGEGTVLRFADYTFSVE